MAKQSGMGDNAYVDGYDVSGDTQAIGTIAGGPAVIDVTPIDKSAMERIGGRRDGRLEFTSFWNPGAAADDAHNVWSTLPTTDRVVSYLRGTTLGNPAAALVAKQINYDGTRGADGEFTLDVATEANGYGLQWGVNLTAGITQQTGAGNTTSIDGPTSPAGLGGTAFLQVFAFTGTSATVAVQHSDDDVSFASITALTFSSVTSAPTSQRVASAAGSIKRYIRVNTSGTFSELDFAVVFVRHQTATVF